jgi:hypothetical protein
VATLTPEQFADELHRAGESEFARIIKNRAIQVALTGDAAAKRNATDRLRTRSGNLRRSIFASVAPVASGLDIVLQGGGRVQGGKDAPYLATQEEGATIVPRVKKWLAIPTDLAQTAAGVGRYQTAYDYPTALQFVMLKPGLAMLWDPEKEAPAYWLKKRVTIRGKWFMRDAFKSMQLRIPIEFDDAMQASLAYSTGQA